MFDTEAWKELPFVLWAVHLFVSILGACLPSFSKQLYGVRLVEANISFPLLPALNAGSFFGRLVSSPNSTTVQMRPHMRLYTTLYIADKIGALNDETPFSLVASMLAFAWIGVQDTAGLFLFGIVYGFLAGAITTVASVFDAVLCRTSVVLGARMGMLRLPWALGILVGEPIGGAFLASSIGWMGL